MRDSVHGICRSCAAMCPIVIDREDGRPVRIIGDKHNPVYWGYTCIKGREMVSQLRHPDRLLGSLRRESDGRFTPITSAQALDEVTQKLQRIIAEHGPRAEQPGLGHPAIGHRHDGAGIAHLLVGPRLIDRSDEAYADFPV